MTRRDAIVKYCLFVFFVVSSVAVEFGIFKLFGYNPIYLLENCSSIEAFSQLAKSPRYVIAFITAWLGSLGISWNLTELLRIVYDNYVKGSSKGSV